MRLQQLLCEFYKLQCLLLPTVRWSIFSHEFNFSDEIIILNLEYWTQITLAMVLLVTNYHLNRMRTRGCTFGGAYTSCIYLHVR